MIDGEDVMRFLRAIAVPQALNLREVKKAVK
jgi:hypothetical protein